VNELGIDIRAFPDNFQLTYFGELIVLGEYFKWITENKKTQIVFFQDSQAETRGYPDSSAWVKYDGFDSIYIHFKT